MKRYVFYVIPVLAALSACNPEFLDENPKTTQTKENKYQTYEDFEMAVTGVYQTLGARSSSLSVDQQWGNYAQGLMVTNESGTDEMRCNNLAQREIERDYDAYTVTPSSPPIVAEFGMMYIGISRANEVITRLQDGRELDNDFRILLGESLFLRSLFYFNLVRTYGGVPLVLTPQTGETWMQNNTRKSIQVVLEQIIEDLHEAATYLRLEPNKRTYTVGMTTAASVYGLLARIYLHAASMKHVANIDEGAKLGGLNSYDWVDAAEFYGEAITYCGAVFDLKGVNPSDPLIGITYGSNFWPNKNGQESLFEVQFMANYSINVGSMLAMYGGWEGNGTAVRDFGVKWLRPLTDEYFGTLEMTKYNTIPNNTVLVSDKMSFLDSYKAQVYDYRADWNAIPLRVPQLNGFIGTATLTQTSFVKYNREYRESRDAVSNVNMPQNFVVMRLAEMCLIYAEAKAELAAMGIGTHTMQQAIDMLNAVRKRARAHPDALPNVTLSFVNSSIPYNGTQAQRNSVYAILKPIAGIISIEKGTPDVGGIEITPGMLDTPIKRFRALLMNERKWEFIGEGHRRFDLIRMGYAQIVLKAIDDMYFGVNDMLIRRDMQPYHVFRPIPLRETGMGMQQNDRY